jgi:hypothetical protein
MPDDTTIGHHPLSNIYAGGSFMMSSVSYSLHLMITEKEQPRI